MHAHTHKTHKHTFPPFFFHINNVCLHFFSFHFFIKVMTQQKFSLPLLTKLMSQLLLMTVMTDDNDDDDDSEIALHHSRAICCRPRTSLVACWSYGCTRPLAVRPAPLSAPLCSCALLAGTVLYYSQADRRTHRHAGAQTDTQACRRTNGHTGMQAHRRTHTHVGRGTRAGG